MPKHCLVSDSDTYIPSELILDTVAKFKSLATHILGSSYLMVSDDFTQLLQAWEMLEPVLTE